jgi:hypothetical protein
MEKRGVFPKKRVRPRGRTSNVYNIYEKLRKVNKRRENPYSFALFHAKSNKDTTEEE